MVEAKEKKAPANQAVLFLLYRDGKFLFEKPSDKESSYFGMLKVPSGKLEEGEMDAEALVREFKEELGVSPVDMIYLDSFVNLTPGNKEFLVHSYLVIETEGEVFTKEPNKTKHIWLTYEEALEKVDLVDSSYTLSLANRYLNEARQNKG